MDVGIINQGYYIIGFPWDTEESILEDAKELTKLPLHQLNIGIFTPIPLSRFYKEIADNGISIDQNLNRHDRNNLVYNHPSLNNKLIKQIQKHIHTEFYNTPEYAKRIKTSCEKDSRFIRSFNDYFEFFNKDLRI